jgi:hypothetical protein
LAKKLQKTIGKKKIIKAINEEFLVPGAWQHRKDDEGREFNKHKPGCAVCAVGAIISTIGQEDDSFKFDFGSMEIADLENSEYLKPSYYKALVKGGVYLTTLSDMFEAECEMRGIEGYDVLDAYGAYNTAVDVINKLDSGKRLTEKEKFFVVNNMKYGADNNDKEQIIMSMTSVMSDTEQLIVNYEKEIKKVKRKLVNFVDKNFPARVKLKEETHHERARALRNTRYDVHGNLYDSKQDKREWGDDYDF